MIKLVLSNIIFGYFVKKESRKLYTKTLLFFTFREIEDSEVLRKISNVSSVGENESNIDDGGVLVHV